MGKSALRRLSGNAAAILASLKRVAGAPQMLLGCHSPQDLTLSRSGYCNRRYLATRLREIISQQPEGWSAL
jgi:hypothetical protein